MGRTQQSDVTDEGVASFRWRTLALWAFIVALVSLTALAVVATVVNADALSVIALALAVMAFVVQIIVFIVQGSAASKQAADTAKLNSQTLRALATIEEKSEGTRETVGKINDRILDFAFNKASSEVVAPDGQNSAGAVTSQVFERAKKIIKSSQNYDSRRVMTETNAPSSHEKDDISGALTPQHSFLDDKLSQEDIAVASEIVEQLGDNTLAVLSLTRLGDDLSSAQKLGRPDRAGMWSLNEVGPLHELGLIKRTMKPWSEEPVFVLSEKGKLVAHALLMIPAPADATLLKARRNAEDFLARVENSRRSRESELDALPIE